MKTPTGKRSLESLRIFPFVAWVLIGLFVLFVYNLTNDVANVTERLQNTQFETNTIFEDNAPIGK
jgi:hypothetical protein